MADGSHGPSGGDPQSDAFGRLLEAVHEGVYVGPLDEAGTSVAANGHLKAMLGYAPDAPLQQVRPFGIARFPDPDARRIFITQLRKDGTLADHVMRLRRLDGADLWVEVTARAATPVPGGTGDLRIEALLRDVSERKKFEDQTRDLYHQLLQAEKLAALGQTISGVAHELNNPLATILTWAERLSQRELEDSMRRGLQTILSESERAARIVRNLLMFARKRQSTRAMVDLNHVIRETLALRAYEQRVTNIGVLEALSAGLPPIFADAHQLQQILLNLIINAEQAILQANGHGTLIIRTWYDPSLASVLLEVHDDGPGIPEDIQPRVFDPFFTTKEVGKGTGLGLTVAYGIVQEHGGRIRVHSPESAGTSFIVQLPSSGTGSMTPRPRNPMVPLEELVGRPVLVIEDEPKLAAAVSEALSDVGLAVDHAGDGEEALQQLQLRAYDLIVCDLKMPRIDGQSFFRALSRTSPELAKRVIFVTGDVAGTDAERFLEESGCRWLAKPFRLGDLLRTVREVLAI